MSRLEGHIKKGKPMVAVSVIVPTYNEEAYLRQALDSLVAQTLKNIEIILVNDGSTDGSLAILKEYEQKYSQFHLIDKPNGGYGAAINSGLSIATGEYIGILEPDDFVDKNMFDELYANTRLDAIDECDITPGALEWRSLHPCAHTADIVKSSFYHYWDSTEYEPPTVIRPPKDKELPTRTTLGTVPELAAVVKDHPSIWACIYRRQFLIENDLHFVEAPGAGWVDNPWLFDTMLSAETIVWVPKAYYHYRNTNENSSAYTSNYEIPLNRIDDMQRIFDRHPEADERIYQLFARRVMRFLASTFNGMRLERAHQDLFDRTHDILARMKPEAILDNPDIEETRKIFYREVLGMYNDKLQPYSRSDNPLFTVLIDAHNDYAYISGILRIINQDNSDIDIDIIVQDTGGSWDYTGIFINDIAEIDKRISYLTGSWEEAVKAIRTPYVYLMASNATFTKGAIDIISKRINDTHTDIIYFDTHSQTQEKIPAKKLYSQLFNYIDDFSNICVTKQLLVNLVSEDETWTLQGNTSEQMLRAFLAADEIEFCDAPCRRVLKRNLAHDTVKSPTKSDPGSLRMGSLTRMKQLLDEHGIFDQAEESFEVYAAKGILADLQVYRYSEFVSRATYARETYIPLLLPHLLEKEEYLQRSPEHLLYLLCTNEALYFKYNDLVRLSEASERYHALKTQHEQSKKNDRTRTLKGKVKRAARLSPPKLIEQLRKRHHG